MAKLINPGTLIDHAKNLKVWMELRGRENVKECIVWEYLNDANALRVLHCYDLYGIDTWGKTWRAWDDKPTPMQRERVKWND